MEKEGSAHSERPHEPAASTPLRGLPCPRTSDHAGDAGKDGAGAGGGVGASHSKAHGGEGGVAGLVSEVGEELEEMLEGILSLDVDDGVDLDDD